MKVIQEKFGEINGRVVTAYTMVNDEGIEVTCLDYGCIITKIIVPDQNGKLENIVLGFDTIDEYLEHSPYFGAVIGRVAGRIKNANFELNNQEYQLIKNNNNHHLHGGVVGFDKVFWDTYIRESNESISLDFSYLSPHGEEGYPGNVKMKVTYTLNNKNDILLAYEGQSDQKTLLNLTNHTYFNLSGNLKRDVLDHSLKIKSDQFVELDEELIPTGKILSVENTPFDFKKGRKIKDGVLSSNPQNIIAGNGYDHPFLLQENEASPITLSDDESGRVLVIETNQPSLVLYTATQLSNHFEIRGVQSRKYLGVCLETQGLPNSINQPNFQSCIIDKDEMYKSFTKLILSSKNVQR